MTVLGLKGNRLFVEVSVELIAMNQRLLNDTIISAQRSQSDDTQRSGGYGRLRNHGVEGEKRSSGRWNTRKSSGDRAAPPGRHREDETPSIRRFNGAGARGVCL